MEALKLGWILGNMGNPMTKNLLKAGFEVVVFNRNRDKEKELIELGATSAASTQELMQTCDVVITMLSNDEAVKEVYESENGLLSQDNPGKLIINMSTVSPETRYLTKICTARQVHFIDVLFPGV
jgi:3-hydroxyisobutyrate dehydrogenase